MTRLKPKSVKSARLADLAEPAPHPAGPIQLGSCPVPMVSCACRGVPVPNEEPQGVRMYCSNRECTVSKTLLHRECFEEMEAGLLRILQTKARRWTEEQRVNNLWTKKGMSIVARYLRCKCSKGVLDKREDFRMPDKPLITDHPTHQDQAEARHKKRRDLPALNTGPRSTVAARNHTTPSKRPTVVHHFLSEHSDDEMLPNTHDTVSSTSATSFSWAARRSSGTLSTQSAADWPALASSARTVFAQTPPSATPPPRRTFSEVTQQERPPTNAQKPGPANGFKQLSRKDLPIDVKRSPGPSRQRKTAPQPNHAEQQQRQPNGNEKDTRNKWRFPSADDRKRTAASPAAKPRSSADERARASCKPDRARPSTAPKPAHRPKRIPLKQQDIDEGWQQAQQRRSGACAEERTQTRHQQQQEQKQPQKQREPSTQPRLQQHVPDHGTPPDASWQDCREPAPNDKCTQTESVLCDASCQSDDDLNAAYLASVPNTTTASRTSELLDSGKTSPVFVDISGNASWALRPSVSSTISSLPEHSPTNDGCIVPGLLEAILHGCQRNRRLDHSVFHSSVTSTDSSSDASMSSEQSVTPSNRPLRPPPGLEHVRSQANWSSPDGWSGTAHGQRGQGCGRGSQGQACDGYGLHDHHDQGRGPGQDQQNSPALALARPAPYHSVALDLAQYQLGPLYHATEDFIRTLLQDTPHLCQPPDLFTQPKPGPDQAQWPPWTFA